MKFAMSIGDFEATEIECTMSTGDFEATEIEYTMSIGDFEAFEATRQAINEVVWALKDGQVTSIGVYGKGGVGKTRMVKHVGALVQKNGLFDHVIMATVSQSPDMTKIQGTLADLLGLKLEDDTEFGRARTLRKKIMKGNRMLIVLDDIWKTIDFLSIGIPSYMELQRCNSKVLFTTRIKNVCHTMKTQRKITLNILSIEDSWTLFVKNAVVSFDESEIFYDVAMNVVGECAGLPIALIAVAKALIDKDDLAEWEEAARRLKSSKPVNLDDEENVFNCIRFSYDYLKTEDAKSCFLLCCLFPEDYDIQIEDLLKYGIGNGLFEDSNTMQEARGAIISVVKHLKASSLLLDSEQPGCVRMHDVVRGVAISISLFKDGSPQFLVKAGCELMDWPRINANKGYSAISLMRNKIHKLPKELVCSKLQILLLQSNIHMNEIPELFFQSLDALRVLDLSQTSMSLLPPTFSLLTSLHTLYLDSCLSMITNISILGELKKLEILSMRELPLVKLPIEIGHLTNLRMLDFTGECVDIVPSDVIRNLDKLEELYMQCNFADWRSISMGNEVEGSEVEGSKVEEIKVEGSSVTGSIVQVSKDEGVGEENNAVFDELTGLSHLNILKVFISDAGCLPRRVRSNPNWVTFDICISGDSSIRELSLVSGSSSDYSRALTLDTTISTLPDWFVNVVTRNVEKLQYIKCQGLDNILVEHDHGRLDALKYFSVIGPNGNLEELMNTITWVRNEPVFKNLEELHLVQVGCLKELCVGELPPGSLCNLKLLKVNSCHKLMNALLPSNLLKRLQNLEILICEEIDELEYVFGSEGPELEKIILTKLIEIRLEDLGKLIKIWNGPAPYAICQNLKILVVSRCFELESLFTSDVARCLFQLEDLSIELCPMLDRVIEPSEKTVDNKIVFLALKSLALIKLPQLTRFYGSSGSATIGIDVECPSLKHLHVHRCPQFSTSAFDFHSRNQVQVNAEKPLELVGTTQKRHLSLSHNVPSAEHTVFAITMDQEQQSSASPTQEPKSPVVLSIECLKGSSKADEWTDDMLHTGDIVEELRIGTSVTIKSPYKNGRSGVQKILHASFNAKDTSIQVRVRRGQEVFTKQACIFPNDSAGKKVYMLRSISDPNYVVEFCDRTEADCFELQASAPLLPSSSSARGLKYDVFLSFRGTDIRKGIASELHRQLNERGIETYMDTDLQVGDVISPTLLKAIEESRFTIVILSPDFASSTWCLQEIAKICRNIEYNNRILPLFFNVKADDVLLLKGKFEEAFTKYDNDGLYRSEKLQEWKDALTKVANCLGWNSKNYKTERELVNKIVEDMCSKMQPIENNKGDLKATREAKNKENAASGVTVSGGKISGRNVNLGKQGDVVSRVRGNFIKDVRGNFIKGGPKGDNISGRNVNLGTQGDVVSNVGGDFIKGVGGNFIKGGPEGDIIRGDRGGDGGNSYTGGYAGAGGPAKGNNTFNYGQK